MKKVLSRSLLIAVVSSLVVGCSLKSNELIELKPNLNNLTKRANSAIERRGVEVENVKEFLSDKDAILMENFKDYDLKIKYENRITVVLVCKNDKAIYEDLSCDLKIDRDYVNDNKPCNFYIQNPRCDESVLPSASNR